jgi:hypothetical protein
MDDYFYFLKNPAAPSKSIDTTIVFFLFCQTIRSDRTTLNPSRGYLGAG